MFRATFRINGTVQHTDDLDFGSGSDREGKINLAEVFAFTEGSGTDQATDEFSAARTLGTSSNEDLNFNAGLSAGGVAGQDSFDSQVAFTAMRVLYIENDEDSAGEIVVAPGSVNGFGGPLAAGSALHLAPGAVFLSINHDAGWTVDATHNRLNVSTLLGATYRVIAIGS